MAFCTMGRRSSSSAGWGVHRAVIVIGGGGSVVSYNGRRSYRSDGFATVESLVGYSFLVRLP